MDYLYGKLNFEVEKVDYTGVSSSTANIDINKKEATIKVDVLKTPNHLMIDNLEDDSITYFDGSKEIIIELPKVSDRVLQSEFNNFKNYANEKFESIEEDYNQKIISESERATAAEATKVNITAPYKYDLDTQQLTNTYVYTIVPNEKEPKLIKIVNTRSAEGLSIVQRANDGNICINETPKYDYHAASKKYVDSKVSQEINNILDGAPEHLNTLKEISDALNNNEEIGNIVIQNQTNIANEITRAETAENQIISDLDSYKTSNSTVIEEFKSEYNSKISELEASDASNEQAIQDLEIDYNNKVAELEQADKDNQSALESLRSEYESKVAELEASDAANEQAIADLETEYNAKVEELNNKNNSQDELITSNYNTLNNSITTEIERATKAEEELSATITSNKTAHDDEYNTFKEAVQDNFNTVENSIQGEVTRAKQAEADLATAIEILTNGSTTEEIDSVIELVNYVNEHGTEVQGMKDDISANEQAIGEIQLRLDTDETDIADIQAKPAMSITSTNITDWNDAVSKEHSHSNKTVLDSITSTKVSNWDNEVGAKEAAATAQSKADNAYILAEGKENAGIAQSLINNLDKTITGANSNKTLKSLTQTDGVIDAEFQDISITKNQVSDFKDTDYDAAGTAQALLEKLDASIDNTEANKTLASLTQTNGIISATFQDILIEKNQISDFDDKDYDAAGSADAALQAANGYTDAEISEHNISEVAHNDIRQLTIDHNVNTEAHTDIRQLISNLNAKPGLDKTGTVTSVKIDAGAGLSVDNADAITTSGTRTLSLSTSGVTAATYGPSADVTGNDGATIKVPEITVDTYGRVTSVTERTYTSKDTNTHVTVDSELSSISTNPVQNKVINAKFESLNDIYDSKGSAAAAESAAKGYVDNIVEAYLTGEGAADTIDTLNEIANWIKDDEAGAAKIISDVATNTQDITDLDTRVSDNEKAIAKRLKYTYIEITDNDITPVTLNYLKTQLQNNSGSLSGFVVILYKNTTTTKLYEMYINMESSTDCYAMSFSDNTTYEIVNNQSYFLIPFKTFITQYKVPKVPVLPADSAEGYYLLTAYKDLDGNITCGWELDNTVRMTETSEE